MTRAALDHRAGTRLDHRFTKSIEAHGLTYGLYDTSQHVFQSGGALKDFVFWKRQSITMDVETWRIIRDLGAYLIEFIDHGKNECYRVQMSTALRVAQSYTAGAGPRIGIPLVHWDRLDALNNEISRGRRA